MGGVGVDVEGAAVGVGDAGGVEDVAVGVVDDVGAGGAGDSRPAVEDPVVDTVHIVVVAAHGAGQGEARAVGEGGGAAGDTAGDTGGVVDGAGIVPINISMLRVCIKNSKQKQTCIFVIGGMKTVENYLLKKILR